MRDVKVTLGLGIVLLAAVAALTLTRAPPRVVRVGASGATDGPAFIGSKVVCQGNEVLPAGVSAIRISVAGYIGPRVRVKVLSGSRVLTEGSRGGGWPGSSVTVPVTPLSHAVSNTKLCFDVEPNSELVFLIGASSSKRLSAVANGEEPLGGRIGVSYLASGQGSWWSRIQPLAKAMGIGHALSGSWVALLVASLMAAAGVLAVRLTVRELR